MMRKLSLLSLLLFLAACQQAEETPAPAASGTDAPAASASASASPDPTDKGALNERKDPERLLGYLATAIGAGRWDDAALAWHTAEDGSKMTGAKVRELFGNPEAPLLTFGKGSQEGAAGSLYYEAPVLLLGKSGRGREGVLTLRRVNDVDGAEDWQLAWHVERLEWKK